MSGVTPADLRAGQGRVAVTGCGVRVRYHPEMGDEFESEDGWVMISAGLLWCLGWPARWEG